MATVNHAVDSELVGTGGEGRHGEFTSGVVRYTILHLRK